MSIKQKKKDKKNLFETFYHALDPSLAHSMLVEYVEKKTPPSTCLLGEGCFFKSYLINTNIEMNFALNLLKDEYRGSTFYTWLKLLQKLKKLENYLIPPFEISSYKEGFSLIMPFGIEGQFSEHWLPICNEIENLEDNLKQNKLILNDSIQMKSWNGIPFIHDFSDLDIIK